MTPYLFASDASAIMTLVPVPCIHQCLPEECSLVRQYLTFVLFVAFRKFNSL